MRPEKSTGLTDIDSEQGRQEPNIITGSLALGLFLSVFATVMLVLYGHIGWAWGFSVGAGISLISLFSLGFLVPRLTVPTARGASQFLLALVLFLKVPFYAVALDMVMRKPGV